MIEGADEREGRFDGGIDEEGAAACGAGADTFLLENMTTSLDKGARITNDVVVPDLVMHVWPRTAPRRSESSDRGTLGYSSAELHENR